MNPYHDLILDHYKNPRNFGVLENPEATAQKANASCGDLIEFQIKIRKSRPTSVKISEHQIADKLDRSDSDLSRSQPILAEISDVAWRGVGCAISTAGASLLSERVKSEKLKVQSLLETTDEDMVKMLGGDISPTRIKCATLALKALQSALTNADL